MEGLLLNHDSLKLNIAEYWDEAFASLPAQMFKYMRWDRAFTLLPPSVQPLLEQMFDLMSKEDTGGMQWFVDYKVRDLSEGDCGCPLDGWHLDVVTNPWHKSKPDIHMIYSTEIGTEFLVRKMPVFPDEDSFNKTLSIYNPEALERDVVRAKPNHISMYNRFQLHRGPVVNKPCKRMLLRLTATEVIK